MHQAFPNPQAIIEVLLGRSVFHLTSTFFIADNFSDLFIRFSGVNWCAFLWACYFFYNAPRRLHGFNISVIVVKVNRLRNEERIIALVMEFITCLLA